MDKIKEALLAPLLFYHFTLLPLSVSSQTTVVSINMDDV